MQLALLLSCVAWLVPPQPQAETWDALAGEWEKEYVRESRARMDSGASYDGVVAASRDRLARFEALADAGEGRAVLWLLRHRSQAGPDAAEGRAADLARVVDGGDAEWVARALLELAREPNGLERGELAAYLGEMAAPERPAALRPPALLALAAVAADPAAAAELRLRAAALFVGRAELTAEAAPDDLAGLASALLARVNELEPEWFDVAYFDGGGEVYFERADSPIAPKEIWRSSLEALAERGARPAIAWVVMNTYPRDEASKETLKRHLDALLSGPVDERDLRSLSYRIRQYCQTFGADFVAPRVEKLALAAKEDQRAMLLMGLGDGLCAAATSDAERERGLALLEEVVAKWPDGPEAKRAGGKLFRYRNLVVGKRVPDFETVDADGNAFKLSDYEGKVTVIDFWGFW